MNKKTQSFKRRPVSADDRYEIDRKFCGQSTPQYVLRFCGEFVMQSPFYASCVVRAVGESARRRGALVVTEIPANA